MFASSSAGRPTIYAGLNSSITAFDATNRTKVASCVFSSLSTTLVAMSMHQGDIWATAGSELYRIDSHSLSIKNRNGLESSGYGVGGSLILLSVNGREIALEGHNGYVIGVDLQTGKMLWKTTVSTMGRMSTFLEHKGVIYVSCCGTLHALDPVSGRVMWTDSLKGLGYCNAGLASVFKTTNCHADQPFVAEHEVATAKRRS
jgi:outer membrane protein assembly factor BamB